MLAAQKCNEIKQQVTHLLNEAGCSTMNPLSIRDIVSSLSLQLIPYSTLTEQEVQQLSQAFGGALPPGLLQHEPEGPTLIWYDDTLTPWQQDRAIAHELGHWKRQHCQASSLAEEEAEYFGQLLIEQLQPMPKGTRSKTLYPKQTTINTHTTTKGMNTLIASILLLAGMKAVYDITKTLTRETS